MTLKVTRGCWCRGQFEVLDDLDRHELEYESLLMPIDVVKLTDSVKPGSRAGRWCSHVQRLLVVPKVTVTAPDIAVVALDVTIVALEASVVALDASVVAPDAAVVAPDAAVVAPDAAVVAPDAAIMSPAASIVPLARDILVFYVFPILVAIF